MSHPDLPVLEPGYDRQRSSKSTNYPGVLIKARILTLARPSGFNRYSVPQICMPWAHPDRRKRAAICANSRFVRREGSFR